MILVFAGAGASAAIDPDQYPTTVEFFERIPAALKENTWFEHASQFESKEKGNSILDIEQILSALGQMLNYCTDSYDTATFSGWMLADDRFRNLANARIVDERLEVPYLSDFVREMQNERSRIEDLQGDLYSLVYQFYAPLPPIEALAIWISLIETLMDPYRSLEIFTTNYDRVIEQAIIESNHTFLTGPDAMELATGRRYDDMQARLVRSCWDPRRDSRDGVRLRLTKLHGSVDWQANNDGQIIISNPVYTRDDRHHIILYPGHKGEPNREPFITFHNHLRSVAQQAKAAIFIGYAFRDENINGILTSLPSDTPKYVINKSQSLRDYGFLNGAKHLDCGFTDESVAECIDDLKQRDLASQ